MNHVLIADICSVLATMKGYPPYPPPAATGQPSAMDQAYFAGLHDLSDATLERIRGGVLLAFDERPSVKALREWAISVAPQKAFDIRQLDTPSAPRLTTGGNLKNSDLKPAASGIPESVKAEFARFRAQVPPEEQPEQPAPRRPVYHAPMPEAERPKRMREAARWLKTQGISAPSAAVLAATAEAKWREAQRRSTRSEAVVPSPAPAGR